MKARLIAALEWVVVLGIICMIATCASLSNRAFAALPAPGEPGAPADPRYCGEPARYRDGTIKRSQAQLRRFAEVFPCPATLDMKDLSCTGWAIDHTIPLAVGGCDAPINMQWLPDSIKSCADPHCKDRWERKYHAVPRQMVQ